MNNVNIAMYDLGDPSNKYIECLRMANTQPLTFKYVDDAAEAQRIASCCDGLLLPGGGDIDPQRYGAARKSWCGQPDLMRERVEFLLLDAFIKAGKPVLGICRGAQVICVYFGGTLYQDIAAETQKPSLHFHKEDYTADVHEVNIDKQSLLFNILSRDKLFTNSVHHQAAKQLPECLYECARSDDGIIEAFNNPSVPFVLGIQWHPEHLAKLSDDHARIFSAFADACEATREKQAG